MNVLGSTPLVASVAIVCLGGFVLLRNRRRPLNQLYFLFCCFALAWTLGSFVLAHQVTHTRALYWAHLVQFATLITPAVFFHFTLLLFGVFNTAAVTVAYLAIGALGVANYRSLLIDGVDRIATTGAVSQWYVSPGPWGWVVGAYVVTIVLATMAVLFFIGRRSSGRRRAQARYLLLAVGLAFAGGLHDVFGLLGVTTYPSTEVPLYPLGSLAMVAWAGIPTYTFHKYHLVDIDRAVARTFGNVLVLLLLLVSCFAGLLAAQRAYFGQIQFEFSLIALGVVVIAAFVFPRIRVVAQESIEHALFRGQQDYQAALYKLTQEAARILDIDVLLERVCETLTSLHGVVAASIYVEEEKRGKYRLGAMRGAYASPVPETMASTEPVIAWLHGHQTPAVREELELQANTEGEGHLVPQSMVKLGADVGVPLTTGDRMVGIIFLGPKETGDMFTQEDVQRLSIMANHLAVAIRNARLYNDLTRSQEIIQESDRLSAIGTMAAVLAHEIRNPLVSIRTFTQLLPERYEDEEFRSSFLDLTLSEVDRIGSLINELLAFARPAPSEPREIDINDSVDRISRLLETQAKTHGVSLRLELGDRQILAVADEDQLKQVLMNIVMNAIEASEERGEVTVTTTECFTRGTAFVRIEVRDSGCGIDKAHLEHIFDPFFTTRKDGTGLGLSIAHQLVNSHGGFIDVDSQLGTGTSFYIHIPVESSEIATQIAGSQPAPQQGPHG